MILETIVTTSDTEGNVHIAPFGIRRVNDKVLISPYRPSATLENLLSTRCAVVNMTEDVRVFAGCLTGRKVWPVLPAIKIQGWVLDSALAHLELELEEVREHELRPELEFVIVNEVTHRGFSGFNRAQAAVIEAAILVSRLSMLSREKIDSEMSYLKIAIEKTAGEREKIAWQWIEEAIENYQAMQQGKNQA